MVSRAAPEQVIQFRKITKRSTPPIRFGCCLRLAAPETTSIRRASREPVPRNRTWAKLPCRLTSVTNVLMSSPVPSFPVADWLCLATAGRDGKSIAVRGTFYETADYHCLDIVAFNGGSFIALKDAPGPVPVRVGSCWRARASAALPARRESAATAARRVIRD